MHGLFDTTIEGNPAVGEYDPDADLRHGEKVPLLEDGGIDMFLNREGLPYAPDVWCHPGKVRIGYEISLKRCSYKPRPKRSLKGIGTDILAVEKYAEGLLEEILGGRQP